MTGGCGRRGRHKETSEKVIERRREIVESPNTDRKREGGDLGEIGRLG